MTAADIATALGGRRNGAGWTARCPAHHDRTPSLAITDRDGRVLVHCHGGCSQNAVIAALGERGLWDKAARGRSEGAPDRREYKRHGDGERERMAAAGRLWSAARPATGTVVENYLRLRGITMQVPTTIRFLAAAWHTQAKAHFPAMIGAVQDSSGGLVGVHRTFLANDGQKAPVSPTKMMLGRCAGASLRLAPASSVLAITEGVETALSVLQATSTPTWAALSAPGIISLILPPLPFARDVTLFADYDPAGIAAVERAAQRLFDEGRKVRIALPPRAGIDFNDVLRGVS